MGMPLLECLFQGLQKVLGQDCILSLLDHPLDEGDLLGHTPLTLGNMPVRLGQVFTFLLRVGHGFADDAPDRVRSPSPIIGVSEGRVEWEDCSVWESQSVKVRNGSSRDEERERLNVRSPLPFGHFSKSNAHSPAVII